MDGALIGLVFVPLLAACLTVLPGTWCARLGVVVGLFALPMLLVPVTLGLWQTGPQFYEFGGWSPPLGIRLHVDALACVMLWMVAIIGGIAAAHAWIDFPPGSAAGARFWPLWLLLVAAMNALFLSADLFNLYVCLELVTLAAIPLIAVAGTPQAIRAAMRYLLLALLASLAYLLGVALFYGSTGTLDMYLPADDPAQRVNHGVLWIAVALISAGLLLKAAVFPLHVWLPAAHSSAPGAVSALLSALVVKTAIYLLYRVWLWTVPEAAGSPGSLLLGALGAGALIYGGVAALIQQRLKLIVAYSTVAQLGYLMLLFPLAAAPAAGITAWNGALYQLIAHGLAKAAMFLAAANILHAVGSDRLDDLQRLDQRVPINLFALTLAGVSIMGLPPSGGFIAKWLLLEAAWRAANWTLLVVLIVGSLLAAGYVFRILAATLRREDPSERDARLPVLAAVEVHPVQTACALILALLALAAGFAAAPLLEFVGRVGALEGLLPAAGGLSP